MHTIVVSKWYIARAVRTDTYGLDLVAALDGSSGAARFTTAGLEGGGGRKEREGNESKSSDAREHGEKDVER